MAGWAWLRAHDPGRTLELVVLGLVAALLAWPFLVAQWLPLVDYPEHLGTIAALHGAGSDARFSPYFVVDYPRTQYLLFYWLGDLLAYPLGIDGAGRATVILSVASLPLAVAVWLREHGRPMILGALAGGIAIHVYVLWGFLNYAMGMSLAILALAALTRVVRRPDVVSALWLAVAALAAFYAHAQTFAFFGLGAVVTMIAMLKNGGWPRMRRALGHALAAAVPSVIGVALWLRNSGVIERGVAGTRNGSAAALEGAPPGFAPAAETLAGWQSHSFGLWRDSSGMHLAIAFAAVTLVLVMARGLSRRGPSQGPILPSFASSFRSRAPLMPPIPSMAPELVLALAVGLYFFAPHSYRNIEPINLRFMPLMLALLPALGPRAALGTWARRMIAVCTLALTFYAAQTHRAHFVETDAEMADLRTALDHTEPGARLLGLIFDRESRIASLPIYLHAHQYYQAEVGGLACFGFVEFPISPIQYRPGAEPPTFPARFEWTPEQYDHARYQDAFDYWLIRHPERGAPRSIFRTGTAPEPIYEGYRWTVYRRAESEAR
jgi:hypothetical protein